MSEYNSFAKIISLLILQRNDHISEVSIGYHSNIICGKLQLSLSDGGEDGSKIPRFLFSGPYYNKFSLIYVSLVYLPRLRPHYIDYKSTVIPQTVINALVLYAVLTEKIFACPED